MIWLSAFLTLNLALAASVSSSSSSSSESDSSVATNVVPCIKCPPLRIENVDNCSKGYRRVVLERTCYTCMREVCIKKKYLKGEESLICKKNIPHCDCKKKETCVRTPRTDFRCQEALCVNKIGEADELNDYPLI